MYDWDTYPLPIGTFTKFGTIEQVSYTAYKIEGEWKAHEKIHGPRTWAEQLVVIA